MKIIEDRVATQAQGAFQVIRSMGQAPRLFINLPVPLAAALDLEAGEQDRWQVLGRFDLRLHRLAAPAAKPRSRRT